MVELEQFSRKELLAIVVAQAELIQQQNTRIAELIEQVAELTWRLRANSGNSSLAPSAVVGSVLRTETTAQHREPSDRNPGKQPGTPGSRLELAL